MRIVLAIALLMSLAACASLTKEECLTGNWEEIGFRDGTNGRTSAYIQKHVKACADSGVMPQQVPWEKGRQRGLPAYCVPAKAYSEGQRGRSLAAVCPASQMPALQAANEKGKRYYELSNDINEARSEISQIEHELVGAEDPSVRSLLVQQIRMLNQQIALLELRRLSFQ